MPPWIEHLLALLLVGACTALVLRQSLRTLSGKGAKIGSCCAKGCGENAPATVPTERVVFLPIELLKRR